MKRILFVCTGNICRSAAAERMLRHRFGTEAYIEVSSAGTHGVVGHPIEPSMARRLQADGIDPSGFAARRLTERVAAQADLVLTMETGHRSAVVQAHPQALRHTFTLREFAHLVSATAIPDPAAYAMADLATRLRELTALAGQARLRRLAPPCPDPDIADPYGRGQQAYDQAYAAITQSIDMIERAMRASPPG